MLVQLTEEIQKLRDVTQENLAARLRIEKALSEEAQALSAWKDAEDVSNRCI